MFRHREKYGKGGKQENQMERNEMKHVKCMTDTPTLRLCDPATLWPIDPTPSTVKYANVTSPSVWFGLVWQLVAAHNEHAKPSHWFTAIAYSKVPMPTCVCVWPYTCSCRTLTSRNSRKFNHAQLTRADRRLLQSLLTLSRLARVKGQQLEHALALTSFCLPAAWIIMSNIWH